MVNNSVFWQQDLRQSLTSNSNFIVDQVLCLGKMPLVARYAKLFFSFFISGLIHVITDRLMGLTIWETGAISFFTAQYIGIVVEDTFQWLFQRFRRYETKSTKGSYLPLWQRVVGFIWLAVFQMWATPLGVFPLIKYSGCPPPISIFNRQLN